MTAAAATRKRSKAPVPPPPADYDELSVKLGSGNYRVLAAATGFTRQYISRVLRGRVGTSFSTAIQIADCVEVSLDSLRAFIEHNARTAGSVNARSA